MSVVLTEKARQLLAKGADNPLPPKKASMSRLRLKGGPSIEHLAKLAYEFHYGETVERKTVSPWLMLPTEFKEHWRNLVTLIVSRI